MNRQPPTQHSDTRVHWRERQLLGYRDLRVDQVHHLHLRWRHDRVAHQWGIVQGLALAEDSEAILIQPGVAIDGYGRSLVVSQPVLIPIETIEQLRQQLSAAAIDVWLLYGRTAAIPPSRSRRDCGPGRHGRWDEQPRVRLRPVCHAQDHVDARHPPEVPLEDLPFVGGWISRDDPQREWPVYLGRLTPGVERYGVEMARRPYAGLVGEIIVSSAGDARMQIGGERPGDPLRFAVAVGEDDQVPTDRLTIDQRGSVEVHGDTALDGDLRLAPSRARAPALDFRPLQAPPAAATPWAIYHIKSDDEPKVDQLSLEIGSPGDKGDPARHRFAIGSSDASGVFAPCISVSADCVVTVRGTLRPEQLVVRGPASTDPSDPRLVGEVLANWLEALSKAGTALDAFYSGALRVQIDGFPTGEAEEGSELSYTVSVTNSGPVPIGGVTVVVAFALDQTVEGDAQQIGGPFTLAPQASHPDIAGTFDIPSTAAGKTLTILVATAGRGPADYPVLAMASASVNVVE
jgi:hypothetical protein